jgi:hypothetical protein
MTTTNWLVVDEKTGQVIGRLVGVPGYVMGGAYVNPTWEIDYLQDEDEPTDE